MTGAPHPRAAAAAGAWGDDFCDRLIEAGWLAALASIPVFFNAYTFRAFEPDKAAALRAIALVMVAAWVAKGIEHVAKRRHGSGNAAESVGEPDQDAGTTSVPGCGAIWVLGTALALFAWTSATAAFSIAPRLSLGGSYHRDQGLDTVAAFLVVFISIAAGVRSRTQVERIVTAALIASCPVAVYALVQHVQLDPVPWARATDRPVMSTMGNAIFLAGFLVMLVPLSASRLGTAVVGLAAGESRRRRVGIVCGAAGSALLSLGCWTASPSVGALAALTLLLAWAVTGFRARRRTRAGAAVAAYSTLLALQVGAVLLSASRGPFLGLLSGTFVFALLLAARHRSRRSLIAMAALALGVLAFFALVRAPESPLSELRDAPVAGRLSNVLDTGGSGQVRLLLWQQALDALSADPARAVFGHGPETIRLMLAPHYAPALGQVENREAEPDRAHNETMDRLLTTGFVGTILYYALLVGILWLGLHLGGVTGRNAGAGRLSIVVGAAALIFSVLARALDGSWRFVGLTLPLGLLAGLVLYAAWPVLLRGRHTGRPESRPTEGLLAMALTAGLISHVVETHFGIATVSTNLYFWGFAGLLLAIARHVPPDALATAPRPDWNLRSGAARHDLPPALAIFALAILGLSFGFASAGVGFAADPPYAWLLRVSFVLCGLIILVTHWRPATGSPVGIGLLEAGAYYFSAFLAALLLPRLAVRWADGILPGPTAPITAYFMLLVVAILLLAAALARGRGATSPGGRRRGAACLVLVLAVAPAIWWSCIRPLQADAAFKHGLYTLGNPELNERAVAALESAHRLAPRQTHYTVYLARGLATMGSGQEDPSARDTLYARAEALLVAARDTPPPDPAVSLELGRIQARWADQSGDPAAREERIDRALANFRDALTLSPGRPLAWNAYGSALAIAKRREEALASFEHSLTLDPRFAETYLLGARIHAELGRPADALAVLERGTRVAEPSAALHRALADGYASLGRESEAETEYSAALSIHPRHRGSHVGLVRLRLRAGDCPGAAAALEEMARTLPRDPALPGLRKTLATACPAAGVD